MVMPGFTRRRRRKSELGSMKKKTKKISCTLKIGDSPRLLSFSASATVQEIPATQASDTSVTRPQCKASIDFKWIRDNKEAVEINIKNRNLNANLEAVLKLYGNMVNLQKEVERLREERNNVAKKMKGKLEPPERERLVEEGKYLKESLVTLEEDPVKLKDELQHVAQSIPNMTHPDVPVGGEDSSAIRKMVGSPREFSFPIKDHVQLGKDLDLIDFDSAAENIATIGKSFLSSVRELSTLFELGIFFSLKTCSKTSRTEGETKKQSCLTLPFHVLVVQKLIETVSIKEHISLVKSALKPGFLSLVIDLHGNFVIQSFLQSLGPNDNKEVIAFPTMRPPQDKPPSAPLQSEKN